MDYAQYKKLEFRRKFLRILGASVDITEPETGKLVGHIEMKAWKLKEDIRIFTDKSMTTQLLQIHARSIIDFGATYDVSDATNGAAIFSLRRKGLRSAFVRDRWELLDTAGNVIGSVDETSSGLALVRRYAGLVPFVGEIADIVLGFVPQTYRIVDMAGNLSASLTHRKNPFIVKFGLDRTDATSQLDPRIGVAATSLLAIIDASKN